MSRGQQGQVFKTGQQQNQQYNNEAQTSFDTTQKDIGSYGAAVGQFRASNPYQQGGQAQTVENQQLSDTAAGMAESAGQAVQGAAVRTGQNPAGAIAATENMDIQNQRALAGEEAGATERRLAADTGYKAAGLSGVADVAKMQDTVAEQQAKAAQGALGTEEDAAKTPSFMDELGQGLITAGSNFAGGYGAGMGKAAGCWVAAEVFGGWYEPRTAKVREWVFGPFAKGWFGGRIANLYLCYGERLARMMRRHKPIRWALTQLCHYALRQAVKRG